jgi:hypothetical protein
MMPEQKSQKGKGSKVGRQGLARRAKKARRLETAERTTARNKYARLRRHTKAHTSDGTAHSAMERLESVHGKAITKPRKA